MNMRDRRMAKHGESPDRSQQSADARRRAGSLRAIHLSHKVHDAAIGAVFCLGRNCGILLVSGNKPSGEMCQRSRTLAPRTRRPMPHPNGAGQE